MGPTWGPSGAYRTQVGPMLAPWTLPSGRLWIQCPFYDLSLQLLQSLKEFRSKPRHTDTVCAVPHYILSAINTMAKNYETSLYCPSDVLKLTKSGFLVRQFNTLRPRQNRRHFADAIFKCIFLNENARISLKISLTFVPKVRINNIPALVQIMAWHRPGDKPLSEPMMVSLLTHICVTRPQWVNE